MPCEWCPTDGSYCCVCHDTPEELEPLTPRFLGDYGLGCGLSGDSLGSAINVIQCERGTLGREQLDDLIAGWEQGRLWRAEGEAQQPTAAGLPPGEKIPF